MPADLAVLRDDALRLQPVADGDALGRGKILLEFRRVHMVLAAPVADRHLLGAEQLRLNGRIDRRHAAADDDDAAPDFQRRKVRSLAKLGDELDGVLDAVGVLALGAQRVDAAKPHAEEHRIVHRGQIGKLDVAAKRAAMLDRRCRRSR